MYPHAAATSSRVLSVLFVVACVAAAGIDVALIAPICTEGDTETYADCWISLQVAIPFAYGIATACLSLAHRDWTEAPILDIPAQARARSGLGAGTRTAVYVGCLAVGLVVPFALSSDYDPAYALLAAGGLPLIHLMCGPLGYAAGVLLVHPVAALVAMARWHPVRRAERLERTRIMLQCALVWCITPTAVGIVVGGASTSSPGLPMMRVGYAFLAVMAALAVGVLEVRRRERGD